MTLPAAPKATAPQVQAKQAEHSQPPPPPRARAPESKPPVERRAPAQAVSSAAKEPAEPEKEKADRFPKHQEVERVPMGGKPLQRADQPTEPKVKTQPPAEPKEPSTVELTTKWQPLAEPKGKAAPPSAPKIKAQPPADLPRVSTAAKEEHRTREGPEAKRLAASPRLAPAPAPAVAQPPAARLRLEAAQSGREPNIQKGASSSPAGAAPKAKPPQGTAQTVTPPARPQPAALTAPGQGGSASANAPKSIANASPAAAKKEATAPKTPIKGPEPRGIVVASLHGDLKLVIAGDSAVKVTVAFREYPKSRRKRPQTKSEARREQKVVPLIAKTRQQTREAVIETAREGIYIFSAESEQGETAKATFTLKIFETGAKEKSAKIGTRTISGKAVLAKVLMPEGILWDDESSFTGSLEDSESTTKFNSQTGLSWKEYND